MTEVGEKSLYLKLAGALAVLLVCVLAVVAIATIIAARQIIAWNVNRVQEDVRLALECGVPMRDLTRFWSVGFTHGGVVLVDRDGRIVSTPDWLATPDSVWHGAPKGFFDGRRHVGDFDVHVLLPPRVGFIGMAKGLLLLAVLIAGAIGVSSFYVTRSVSRYVRARDLRERAEALKLATSIQLGSMPQTFPPFPDHRDFDIFATMHPAKEVGGDFYDFYFAGPGRFVFLVADVSGKGVPAALFMMRAKSLLKGLVQTGLPLAEAVTRANASLCEGNAASVFVTAWLGEIDLKTGRVTYVNAGHNPPVVRRAAGGADFVREENPSIFLGALPDVTYVERELSLASGDSIYLYTDGITEQIDEQDGLFGEERLLAALRDAGIHQRELLADVMRAVARHAGGVAQFDDQTQLELVWRGSGNGNIVT